MENKRIHWGIIGCGDVTEKKSGPAFYTYLSQPIRRDETRRVMAARLCKETPFQKWYDTIKSD
jgi:hypothetical protein